MAIVEALGLLAAASSVGSGVFSALGGSAEKRAANEQAALIDDQARQARYAGAVQKHKIRYMGRRAIGAHVASAGAGGVDPFSGSAGDRAADIQGQVDEDLFITDYNIEASVANLQKQAQLIRRQGKRAEIAGQFGGAISALGGLTRAGTYYYGYGDTTSSKMPLEMDMISRSFSAIASAGRP